MLADRHRKIGLTPSKMIAFDVSLSDIRDTYRAAFRWRGGILIDGLLSPRQSVTSAHGGDYGRSEGRSHWTAANGATLSEAQRIEGSHLQSDDVQAARSYYSHACSCDGWMPLGNRIFLRDELPGGKQAVTGF